MPHEKRLPDSTVAKWIESGTPLSEADLANLPLAVPLTGETAAAILRELNGPLTALMLYMGEIKLHSRRLIEADGDRSYLQQIIENALQQTMRVCAFVERLSGAQLGAARPAATGDDDRNVPRAAPASVAGRKPLTRREREVLKLISEGHTNKQGALRMRISPRTFESHRAEVMRKLGARNTADLVRAALLYRED
jgi:DNA-binding CsgD family transcriptional regulator